MFQKWVFLAVFRNFFQISFYATTSFKYYRIICFYDFSRFLAKKNVNFDRFLFLLKSLLFSNSSKFEPRLVSIVYRVMVLNVFAIFDGYCSSSISAATSEFVAKFRSASVYFMFYHYF